MPNTPLGDVRRCCIARMKAFSPSSALPVRSRSSASRGGLKYSCGSPASFVSYRARPSKVLPERGLDRIA
jgi:hypothetical protein